MVQFGSADHETVKGRAHLHPQEIRHHSRFYLLVRVAHPSQPETFRSRLVCPLLSAFLCLQQLLNALLNTHKFRRLVYFLILENIFLSPLLYFDID